MSNERKVVYIFAKSYDSGCKAFTKQLVKLETVMIGK
jgi:hypothetical protein